MTVISAGLVKELRECTGAGMMECKKALSATGGDLEKELATIEDKPYVNVLQMDVDPINPKKGFVELDFNDNFVTMLQSNGYTGNSDEDTVNTWFNDLCRTILQQELADQDFGLDGGDNTPADVVKVTDEDIAKVKQDKEGK